MIASGLERLHSTRVFEPYSRLAAECKPRPEVHSKILLVFVALQHRNFRLLWAGLLVSFSGSFMQAAAMLWHVSLLVPDDRRALALGMVGLVRVAPVIVFSLISGVAADAFDRRTLMLLTQSVMAVAGGDPRAADLSRPDDGLADLPAGGVQLRGRRLRSARASGAGAHAGAARAPAQCDQPEHDHGADRVGRRPGAGRRDHRHGGRGLGLRVQRGLVPGRDCRAADDAHHAAAGSERRGRASRRLHECAAALEGLRFVFRSPLIRSTMLLDFFATFFSSATALLPIFAQDVLGVGARGYGWLYAAPAAGAVPGQRGHGPCGRTDRTPRHRPRRRRAGLRSGHGRLWLCRGSSGSRSDASRSTGAADTVSMVFRNLIRQLETPDHLRGRMTGVNMVFFMGGPQLGELEAGLVANWLGPIVSVVSGGIGCLIATTWVAAVTPPLRAYRRTAQPEVRSRI